MQVKKHHLYFFLFFLCSLGLFMACNEGTGKQQSKAQEAYLSLDSLLNPVMQASSGQSYRYTARIDGQQDTLILKGRELEERLRAFLSKFSLDKPVHIGRYAVEKKRTREGLVRSYQTDKEDFAVKRLSIERRSAGKLRRIHVFSEKSFKLYKQTFQWDLTVGPEGRLKHVEIQGSIDHRISGDMQLEILAEAYDADKHS